MPCDNLADFLAELEDDRELVRIAAEVDPVLEIAEITDRVSKAAAGGRALFFEKVKGKSIPVVTNVLGSESRVCRALRAGSFDEAAARVADLVKPNLPEGWLGSLKIVPQLAQLIRLPPKVAKTGVCQQVVKVGRDVDLRELPVPLAWPREASPTITAGQVYTRSLSTGLRSAGLYPIELRGHNSLAVHWDPHQDGWRNFNEHRQAGRQMPVAVVLGGDPVLSYAAFAPFPAGIDPLLVAGFLRGDSIELIKCRSIDLEVPASAEFVIEGAIDTAAPLAAAGPIALPTGFYSLPEESATIEVTAVTHRSNPVFPAMIPGHPPAEEFWLGKATERMMLPLVRLFVPELVDLHFPKAGAFRNLVFVSLRKEYPQQARKLMNALWSLGGLMVTKIIVAVDAEVYVRNEDAVWFQVGANVHPGRDVLFCEGPTHFSDHAAPVRGMGHKIGIDATRKLPEEGHPRPWPDPLEATRQIRELVDRRWAEYGLGGE